MNSDSESGKADNPSGKTDQATLEGFAFAKRVEDRLAELDRDWAWLSREAGISTSALSDMRTKGRIPRADRAIALAKALKMDFELLATGKVESRERLEAISQVRGDLAPDQLAVLRLFGRLSAREREGVYSLMATLAGVEPDLAVLSAQSSATLHAPNTKYRGEED